MIASFVSKSLSVCMVSNTGKGLKVEKEVLSKRSVSDQIDLGTVEKFLLLY